jgi:hypothetical protein
MLTYVGAAAAVVMCISEAYNLSPFCRTEADYCVEVTYYCTRP